MAEQWASYFCNVNDRLASIFLNLGLHDAAPDKTRPHLLFVWVYFKNPRPDGLSSQEEFPTLSKLEDSLVAAIEMKCGAVMPGRITTTGRREFYFYAPNPSGFQEALDQGLADFSNYRYRSGHKEDPEWSQYLQVLYPSPAQRQKIENRKVLDVLERHGDSLKTARAVMHWAYFNDPESRGHFKKVVAGLGYLIDEESSSEDPRKYCLRFHRKQAVTAEEIDEAVDELFQLAEKLDGEYDGWEAEVISDGPSGIH